MSTETPSAEQMLREMAAAYAGKIPEGYDLKANIVVRDGDGETQWHVLSEGGQLTHGPGLAGDAQTTLTMTGETLAKLYRGQWSGLGAAGRAHIRDAAPIDFTIPQGLHPLEAMRRGYYFLTHFFSVSSPTLIPFGPEHTRKIHGGHAAPLFYDAGLRSAYYRLEPGDVLNEDGAKDPMHQGFVVISGRGAATIGQRTLVVRAGQAVYIPANTIHMLRPEGGEPVELIWLAWGAKA